MSDIAKDAQVHSPTPKLALVLIFVGLALVAMGQTVLFAVLGPVAREIGLTELQTGAIISVSALLVVATSPGWGRLSDRIGRKRIFAGSIAGFALTSLGFALLLEAGRAGWFSGLSALAVLIAARSLYAVLSAGGQPAAGGFIADTSPPETRSGAMALIGGAFGIGSIIGPATAFVFGGFGVLAPLYVIAGLGVIWSLVVMAFMHEPARTTPSAQNTSKLSAWDPKIRWLLVGVALLFAALSMVQQTLAFYIQDIGKLSTEAASQRTGLLIAVVAVSNLAAFVTVATLKPPSRLLILVGGALAALGIGLLLYPVGLGWLIVAHICIGLGFGAFLPGAQTAASLAVNAESQGAVAGFVSAAMAGGYIIGPVLGTSLYMRDPLWTYGVAALIALLGSSAASFRYDRGTAA